MYASGRVKCVVSYIPFNFMSGVLVRGICFTGFPIKTLQHKASDRALWFLIGSKLRNLYFKISKVWCSFFMF